MSHRAALFAAVALAAGCLPVELDVTSDGQLVISREEGWFLFDPATYAVRKLRDAGADVPVFARVSPDGRELLTISEVHGQFSEFDLSITPLAGGEPRRLLRVRNPAYVEYSPDGRQIALTCMSTEAHEPGRDAETLDLVLLDLVTSATRVLAKRVGPQFRWQPGGTHLWATQVSEKPLQDFLRMNLVRIEVASGTAQTAARLLTSVAGHFDVAPDGRHVALCVAAAAAPDAELPAPPQPQQRLLIFDVDTGVITAAGTEAAFALYSPDGDALLVGAPPFSGALARGTQLLVTDAAGLNPRVVAEDLYVAPPLAGGTAVYPGWIDGDRLFYFSERRVYGRVGRALALMTVRRDGADRRCVQPWIDLAAAGVDPAAAPKP